MIHCKRCGEYKQPASYTRGERGGILYKRIYCIDCARIIASNHNLMLKHGIDLNEYERLLKLQNGKCAICRIDRPTKRKRMFDVDHDHDSLEIRGLLCNNCNIGLGKFKDSIQLLEKAIAYLKGAQDCV